jgi:Asp-tRNA(Asn)/Glu-tRNA(Gln) amidotransferase A subunit family amidase
MEAATASSWFGTACHEQDQTYPRPSRRREDILPGTGALYLDAAERGNGLLNAYITLTAETAFEAAARADEKLARGEALMPLEGIPFVLKDNISTAGLKTTCASKMLETMCRFLTPMFGSF